MSNSVKTLAIAGVIAAAVAGTATITHAASKEKYSAFHLQVKTIVPQDTGQHALDHQPLIIKAMHGHCLTKAPA